MKRGYLTAIIMLIFLSGCGIGKSYDPDHSSVFVAKDGTLKSALVEEIETKAKSEELEKFANSEIDDFNKLDSEYQVKLEKASVKGNEAKLVFSYNSFDCMKDFAAYTQDNSFNLESVAVFKLSDIDLTSIDAIYVPEGVKGDYIAVINGSADVYTEGKITYVSNNIEFNNNNAKVDGFGYIVFK